VLCIISVSLVCLDYFAKLLASQAISSDAYIVEEYISTKTRLHEGLLTFKQSSSYELLRCFHYSFSYCYFLVVHQLHLHRDHLVATFELSHILTNTVNNVFLLLI